MAFSGRAARIPGGEGLELLCSCLPSLLGMQGEQEESAGFQREAPAPTLSWQRAGKLLGGAFPIHLSPSGTGNGTISPGNREGHPSAACPDLLAPSRICSFNFGVLFAAPNLPSASNWRSWHWYLPKTPPRGFPHLPELSFCRGTGKLLWGATSRARIQETKSLAFPFDFQK